MKRYWLLIAAALVVEYLLFSVLFDAIELLPGGFDGIGAVAPLPIIAAVALFILGASANASPLAPVVAASYASPAVGSLDSSIVIAGPGRARVPLLVVGHLLAYAAFLGVAWRLRQSVTASGTASTPLYLLWSALGVLSLGALAALVLPRDGLLALVRRTAGPVLMGLLVGGAAWYAGQTSNALWEPLSPWTLRPVVALVGAFTSDLVFIPERLEVGTSRFSVTVAAICSGYEGMGLVAVLVGAFVYSFRRTLRLPHALLLPVFAVALAYCANILRIAALIFIGDAGAPEVAIGGFHSKAGWVLFCVIALGTTWLGRRAAFFQRERQETFETENPTAAYVVPLLALVAAALVTGLASDGRSVDGLEPVRLAAAGLALWVYRDLLREAVRGAWSWVGPAAGAATFVLWMALVANDVNSNLAVDQELSALPKWQVAMWMTTRIIGSVLIVPIVEELAFRGFLLRRVVSADFTAVSYRQVSVAAVLVSSVAFGALHQQWVAGALAGVLYAGAAWVRGRLADAVVAHMVTNALIAVVAMGWARWSLW